MMTATDRAGTTNLKSVQKRKTRRLKFVHLKEKLQVYKFKFDLQPGSLTDQVAGEHQPSYKHP